MFSLHLNLSIIDAIGQSVVPSDHLIDLYLVSVMFVLSNIFLNDMLSISHYVMTPGLLIL